MSNMALHAQGTCDLDCKWCNDEERRTASVSKTCAVCGHSRHLNAECQYVITDEDAPQNIACGCTDDVE